MTRFASFLWSLASAFARSAAGRGLLKRERLEGVRVISVGNLQVGGAGKTPLVAQIAREAHERGLIACILCRGYGGQWEYSGSVIGPGENTPPSALCGDEAALLHELAPHAWIGVGSRRARQFEQVVRKSRVDLVILDDGFQHWKLARDLDLVAVTSLQWGRSLFRDFPRAIRRAQLAVWTKGEDAPPVFGTPLVRVRYRLAPSATTRPILLVTGVAQGAQVAALASASGYSIRKHVPFPDHARYIEPLVRGILDRARDEGARVAVTGKDWVKWRELNVERSEVEVLEPELEMSEEGRQLWSRVLWGS